MGEDRLFIAALQGVPDVGAKTIRSLVQYFGSAKGAWEASHEALRKTGFMKESMVQSLSDFRRNFSLDRMLARLERHEIRFVTIFEEEYPPLLREIHNPPAILFMQGKGNFSSKSIGIVGARKATTYGRRVAQEFAHYLSVRGISVVSGGATGIDSYAHEGALLGLAPTVAVMGCGLDITYPRENNRLFEKIRDRGLLISEYVPGTKPLASNFPARNRIISGLVSGVIVVEARSSSGSLITADMALSEGRDVYAVPGNIYSPFSAGVHWLIQQGAMCLLTPETILGEYGWLSQNDSSQREEAVVIFTDGEKKILGQLDFVMPTTMDQLMAVTGLSLQELHQHLWRLTTAQLVGSSQGGYILLRAM